MIARTGHSSTGELLIATPAYLQQAIADLAGLQQGVIVLAVPPMICAGCGKPRSLFANADGKTLCVADCAQPNSLDG